ncbi:hypothetical protein COOONC_05917 [Cooperia oncophora]
MGINSLLEQAEAVPVKLANGSSNDIMASMGFLFKKVNPSVLDPHGEHSCFLVDCCLHPCLENSKKTGGVTKDVILYSTVIKRILTIIQDFSYSLKAESQQLVIDYVFRSWDFTAEVVSDIILFDLVESPYRWPTHVNFTLSCLSSEVSDVRNAVKDRLFPKLIRTKLLKEEFLPLVIEQMKASSAGHTHFSDDDLQLIRVFVTTNMVEQTPAIRQKILAGLRKVSFETFTTALPQISLFISLHSHSVSLPMAETSEQILKGRGGDIGQVERYNDFIRTILQLSFESLSPGANFCRRIMALSILQCFYVEDTMRPHGKTMFFDQLTLTKTITPHQFAALVSCLDDSFQLCQISALEILKKLPVVEGFDFHAFKCGNCRDVMDRFAPATINISDWCIECSSELQQWWIPFLQKRLIPLCFDVAAVVTPVVHSMSPEGYIPEEALEKNGSNSATSGDCVQMAGEVSQLLLVCCWRAHKHVSAILAWAVVECCPHSMLTSEDVCRIGDFYWLQLTECKHCGAFETAVEGSVLGFFAWV